MFSIGRQQVDGVRLPQTGWAEIAPQGLFVGEHHDNFLVRRGWGSAFQGVSASGKRGNLPIVIMYVMLSRLACQLIVFIRVRPRSAAR
jgi:hypothetical protein